MGWEVFDSLLASTPTVPAVDAACHAGGIPIIGGVGKVSRTPLRFCRRWRSLLDLPDSVMQLTR